MWKYWFVVLLVSTSCIFNLPYDAFAQTKMYTIPTPNIFFTNVHVDANPVPDKPFTVYADVQSQSVNWSDLIVYMTPPAGISVVSPIVSSLTFTSQGNTMRASWTMLTSDTGSYHLIITAHSNFPLDTETFDVTVNVGSPHSIVLDGISLPGNIFPNDDFVASIKLKNSATVADTNILAQISVPAGLQLLDDVTQSVSSLDPGKEVVLKWRLKAENAGSYTIAFSYSSTNAGSNSASSAVNVGIKPIATGALLSLVTHSTTLRPNSINPIVVDVQNNGIQDIHNLQLVSASGGGYVSTNTPLWMGDLGKNEKKTLTLQIDTSNETLPLQIPIVVKYDSDGNSYAETYQTGLQLENHPDFKINTVMVSPPLSYAGDTADKIDVQIFNAGMEANDVYATLNLPAGLSPAWGGATSVYFGKINTFQTVTASFYVNVNSEIASGNYPLSLLVKTGDQQTPMDVNFIVAPKAQFQLISEDDSQLYPGAADVPFKIVIKNIGTIAAQTLTTKLLAGNSVPGVKSDSITSVGNMEDIGTVLPGQTFVTTFMVNLDPAFMAGDKSTTVELDWSQNSTGMSNAFVGTVIVPYHVAYGPNYLMYYNAIPWTYVVILIALAVGLALFVRMRKKKMKMIELESLQLDRNYQSNLLKSEIGKEDVSAEKRNEKTGRSKPVAQDFYINAEKERER